MNKANILVASNRGPVSFSQADDGSLSLRRGGGGLVSGLSAAAAGAGTVWVCAALSEADRLAVREAPGGRLDEAGHDTGGIAVHMIDVPEDTFHRAYNTVANSVLWFVHHLLFDTPNAPAFDAAFRADWAAYRDYNGAFADALVAESADGARVFVQDYHLTLTPRMLRDRRPDLRIAHFSHTPWAPPEYYRLLPADIGREVLTGILGADEVGFLTERWADAFLDCCAAFLDAEIDHRTRSVSFGGRVVRVGVYGLGVDGPAMQERAAAEDVAERREALRAQVGDRRLIVRVDRTELSKNIVRGLAAYREFLTDHPEWHGRVVHLAFAYPSRHDLPEYRAYTEAVRRTAEEINAEFGTEGWVPLILQVKDDYPRSLAAYQLADVLVVNPIRDGMNLVAKEGPVLSQGGCALVLSTEAGAAGELGDDALLVNPYDVSETARALHAALEQSDDERKQRTARLADAATMLPPQRWFAAQAERLG
ncbi:alpha,alpha-trehalose-phosphate synthase (UDP-forming) [Allonocardiopsis opalescens]|uniref:Trehalose 6-phosphate synthase n=1 Tax=Allonocardiopsis opalescens TaxID=1144618 RepID=A0A2T0QA18_9ACTN|nr:trehalose-6-phosphate synthase [Allonocardiopsis opalescens]PRY00685.1 trehalose 6-phosphate synthase [Allonocardiopsis opalescens]